jgi:hypothetical protein
VIDGDGREGDGAHTDEVEGKARGDGGRAEQRPQQDATGDREFDIQRPNGRRDEMANAIRALAMDAATRSRTTTRRTHGRVSVKRPMNPAYMRVTTANPSRILVANDVTGRCRRGMWRA